MLKVIAIIIPALGAGLGIVAGCSTLPSLDNRSTSMALLDTDTTRLGRAIAPRVEAHPGKSGIYPLLDGRNAFAARVLLAQAAERTLDVQYYIWHGDMSGTLMFDAMRAAADRGVRVRLLLDDNNTSGLDETLTALDSHANIEVRLFNPFVIRKPRALGYLTDFFRLNRRMHNKSFTADNQATIIGGRNVGDEYFAATDGTLFVDLDVIAVGPVVTEVSQDFDRYWASESSYPVDRLLPPADPARLAQLDSAVSFVERDPAARAYVDAVRTSAFVSQLVEGSLTLEWATTRMVSDDPAKGLGEADGEELLPHQLGEIVGEPSSDVDLVSAYFVPTAAGVDSFVAMAKRGVRIRVLTNALEATDVAPVHAGYAKRRKPMLDAGIELYELRRASRLEGTGRQFHRTAFGGSGGSSGGSTGSSGGSGSSASSLHAKTFSVDRSRVFIGSFNFDPRSAKLNTEMGFIIDSPVLAQRIATTFDSRIPALAYEVRLSGDGQLYWVERHGEEHLRHEKEPGTSFWERAGVWVMSLLPIEWLL